MLADLHSSFRLGPWTVEPFRGAVVAPDGSVQHLEPKVMEVLVLLASQPGSVLSRERLIEGVWSEHVAADQLLTRAVSELRRVLQDDHGRPGYIETVPKRGYRLIADVRPVAAARPTDASSRLPWRKRPLAVAIVAAFAFAAGLLAYRELATSQPPDARASIGNEEPARSGPAARKLSIAVLPFADMSNNGGNEYFAEGMSEEIRNLLAGIPDARVIARTSSTVFRDKGGDVRSIGELLGVESVLEGTVRKSGDRVRITARLIDAVDSSTVWSGTYERSMSDIFRVQDEVAAAIIDALQLHIGAYPARGRPTEVAGAYALFLKAQLALNVQDPKSAETALLRAIELDPRFAEAFELLAHVYWTEVPGIEYTEGLRLMRDAAAKAVAIDPGLDFARAILAEGDRSGSALADVLEAQTAVVRAQPNRTQALRTLTWNLLIAGYVNECLEAAQRFVEIDPLSPIAHIRYAAANAAAGRQSEAMASMQIANDLGTKGIELVMGEVHLARGNDEQGIALLEAWYGQRGNGDVGWVRELVTGARDPLTGRAHLDQAIASVVQSPHSYGPDLEQDLNRLYLYFGHLDRYFEIMLGQVSGPASLPTVEHYLWNGLIRPWLGFTAHPGYLELAEALGLVTLWEQRGPPDFCEKRGGTWACR